MSGGDAPAPAGDAGRSGGGERRVGGETALRIARLLEEGNGVELRRLVADLEALDVDRSPEAVLAAWLAARGGRELSHRSRAFWGMVLGTAAGPAHPLAEELWPLASPGP